MERFNKLVKTIKKKTRNIDTDMSYEFQNIDYRTHTLYGIPDATGACPFFHVFP